MSRRRRWSALLEAARLEALTAIELYNRPRTTRRVENFLVHMHIAWMCLLQAEFLQAGINFHYRDAHNRYIRVDGEPKAWDLLTSVVRRWPDADDPVRRNLELTIQLRNKVEHRGSTGVEVLGMGFFLALVINFDEELTNCFGAGMTIAHDVHLPLALNLFSREGMASLARIQQSVEDPLRDFFVQARADVPDEVASDHRFELRIDIVHKRAPKDLADLAVTFVREDQLAPAERAAYEQLARTGRVIIREKHREVSNLGNLKPKAASKAVQAAIPFHFGHSLHFPRACQHFKVRPPSSAAEPAATMEKYCVFDLAHGDYTYTPAFVDLLIRHCSSAEGFREVTRAEPRAKDDA
ncbi:MAG TPA: DUF3644 domain-containing protein [Candidatus Acidoferrales bacterium]|nr:DUF3644 domain-containing protein [Candidatus Acidoferrales bacterium]